MVLPHNLKCPVSITKPRPVGVCDRSGALYYLEDMVWQWQWSAEKLVNQRILVGPDQVDRPSEFLKTPRFGPEPAPLPNARPTHYATQNLGGEPPLNTVSEILGDDE